jgi:hypothetical protein
VLLAAAGLGIAAGHIPTSPGRYVAMHTAQADDPHSPCSLTEQIGVGIDRGLPWAPPASAATVTLTPPAVGVRQ